MRGSTVEYETYEQFAAARQRRRVVSAVVQYLAVVFAVLVGVLTLNATQAEGRSPCRSGVVQRQAVVHHAAPQVVKQVVVEKVLDNYQQYGQQQYAPPVQNFFYSVGQPLVQQAQMASAVKDALAEYQFNAVVNATVNGAVQATGGYQQQPVYQQPPAPQPPPAPAQPEPPPTFSFTAPGAAQQHCAGCHTGPGAKGGFDLRSASDDDLRAAWQRMKAGTMPPAGPLAPNQLVAVMEDLLASP